MGSVAIQVGRLRKQRSRAIHVPLNYLAPPPFPLYHYFSVMPDFQCHLFLLSSSSSPFTPPPLLHPNFNLSDRHILSLSGTSSELAFPGTQVRIVSQERNLFWVFLTHPVTSLPLYTTCLKIRLFFVCLSRPSDMFFVSPSFDLLSPFLALSELRKDLGEER